MVRKLTPWLVCVLLGAGASFGAEWPQWRGDGFQGVSQERGLVADWSPEGENLVWTREFIGRSTPVVFDGRACVIGRVGEGIERQETVACFDAGDGQKLWERRHNVYNTTVPFNRVGWASLAADPDTGYVYAHGVAGQLIVYDRRGEVVWSRFLTEEFGRLSGYGGRTQTPLVDGDQLILTFVSSGWGKDAAPRHRYFSFDKRTGQVLWIATPGGMPFDMNTQSAPVVAEISGQRLLIAGNADGWVYALQIHTGKKVWGFQLSRRGLNSTVLVAGDTVFAGHSEENLDDPTMGRLVAIDGTGQGDVTKTHELWRINELSVGFPSPAYKDGVLYHVDNSANLYAIDAKAGKVLWEYSVGTVGKASPVLADGKLLVPETNGRFHILEPGEGGAKSLSMHEIRMPDERYAEIYGSPSLAYGRIYLATEAGVFCIGDKAKPIRVPKRKRAPAAPAPRKGGGELATILVVPAEGLIEPGQSLEFEARGFDAAGNPLGPVKVDWETDGLAGKMSKKGSFRADRAQQVQAGSLTATASGVRGSARLRVIPPLPWNEDFDSYEVGKVPPHWIGAAGKFVVQERDGEKVLTKLFRERGLLRNALFMGSDALTDYTISADLMGVQVKRRRADIGLIAGGYTLDLMGNHQRVQVRSWTSEERMAQQVTFPWEMGVWYRMKLRVEHRNGKGYILGKIWKRDTAEPEDWTIEVEDPLPIEQGSPGLIGYSPGDIYYDNILVTPN